MQDLTAVRLVNTVRPYAWGSTSYIQDLLGSEPDGEPAAELWMGAHPGAPSRVGDLTLTELVATDPVAALGTDTVRRFGHSLPFLLKVLAAERPLSIQAHPTVEQARAGCADEDARGIPRDAPTRNYVDANHKPEILVALTDFDALCGFRPVEQTAEFLAELDRHGALMLSGFPARIIGDGGLRDVVTAMLTMPKAWQHDLLDSVLPVAASLAAGDGRWAAECGWVVQLAEFYPGDAGVVLALLMNLVRLAPGQALFLSAGRIHAYLHGAGVELMASSDNVLRCGLTGKHIDPPELLRVLDFSTEDVSPMNPGTFGPWSHYPVPIEDFVLNRLTLGHGSAPVSVITAGPQIVLVLDGELAVTVEGETPLVLRRGESAFLPAAAPVSISGVGDLFQATTNLGV